MRSAQQELADLLAQIEELTEGESYGVRLADCLLDFVAAVLAGAKTDLGRWIIRKRAHELPDGYAFALSYLAEISEFSHGHNKSAGHVGSTPLPVVLACALGQRQPNSQCTTAAMAGYEAFARFGQSLMPALERWGSISTGFSGCLGAAAAMARMEGLDADRICSALGIAAYLAPLTPVEGYLSGANSAEAAAAVIVGMMAARLASGEVRGSPRLLDDLHQRIVGQPPRSGFAPTMADSLALDHLYFKPYPCCRFTHGAIQAALDLRTLGIDATTIERVVVEVPPRAARMCGDLPDAPPRDYLARQFSLPYLVSLALLAGKVTDEEVLNPTPELNTTAFEFARGHLEVAPAEGLVQHGNVCPTVLRVHRPDGSVLERQVLAPWGCPQVPMTREHLRDKFHCAATRLPSAQTKALEQLALNLAWPELSHLLFDCLATQAGGGQSA